MRVSERKLNLLFKALIISVCALVTACGRVKDQTAPGTDVVNSGLLCSANAAGQCYIAQALKSQLDPQLIAGNIASGVTILGVTGSATALNPACSVSGNQPSVCSAPGGSFWTSVLGTTVHGINGSASATIPAGYYDGVTDAQMTDTRLFPGNVRSGITIFGVTGTYNPSSRVYSSAKSVGSSLFVQNTVGTIYGFGNVTGELANGSTQFVGGLSDLSATAMPEDISKISESRWGLHTCGVYASGALKCWGANESGQLGIGANTPTVVRVPTQVAGLNSGVAAVSTGVSSTCSLSTVGGVKCWGKNDVGQIGNGNQIEQDSPIDVVGLNSGVSKVIATPFGACALTTAGGVQCWGDGTSCGVGDGSMTVHTTPVAVSGLASGVADIISLPHDTCAIMNTGELRCWGANPYGELNDGVGSPKCTPVTVAPAVQKIAFTDASVCALTPSGSVNCWGHTQYGVIGNGSGDNVSGSIVMSMTPPGLSIGVNDIVATSNGLMSTYCARLGTTGIRCWGYNGTAGSVGVAGPLTFSTPQTPSGLTASLQSVIALKNGICTALTSNQLKCWGVAPTAFGQSGSPVPTTAVYIETF